MLQALIGPVTGLLDKFIPDADEKAKLAHEIATMSQRHAQELAKGQLEINKAEAQHRSIFVAGWRPFLGWILASAMGWHFILHNCSALETRMVKLTVSPPGVGMDGVETRSMLCPLWASWGWGCWCTPGLRIASC